MNDTSANEQSPSNADSGPGVALLAERRRQNLSLGDVSRQLKLSVRQVEALERDDYSGFQSPVFVHGFIRNYAKLLALDPKPLIGAADRLLNPAPALPPMAPEAATPRVREGARAGKPIWPLAAGVVAVVLVAGLVFMNRGGQSPKAPDVPASPVGEQVAAATTGSGEKRPPAKPAEKNIVEKAAPDKAPAEKRVEERAVAAKPVEKTVPSVADNPSVEVAGTEAVETGPRMTIRMIFEQDSWVEIKDRSGTTVFGQLNAAGTRRSASGEPPLSIVVGNAAGVRLFQGDKSIDLVPHTRVDVARLTVE